jgi:hypothetical protein
MPLRPGNVLNQAGEPQYAVVRIEAPVQVLQRLRDAPGLIVVYESSRLIEGGRGSVDVYATDDALGLLVQPGVTLTVVQSKEELAAHEARVRQELEGAAELSWIEVKGTLEELRSLLGLEGVHLAPEHLKQSSSEHWTVKAEATPAAIEYLRTHGFDVRIDISAEEASRRIDTFYGEESLEES